ncbi:hypothetical protein [uncultured Devosia sp.]|uniref:hypothetical protein n=1 Tax=uncultured Devosia sp. TaxID=211434 RepID=UPI0035CB514C
MQRRSILAGLGMAAATPIMLGQINAAFAQEAKASSAAEYYKGVAGPAALSKVTSEEAVTRATNANAKEFAGFELEEAMSVGMVLREEDIPEPPMDAKSQATFDTIQNAADGDAFDKAYIAAQLENHEFLSDLATAYLATTSPDEDDAAEVQGRHLATLMLAVFKEHVAITKRILGELGGA